MQARQFSKKCLKHHAAGPMFCDLVAVTLPSYLFCGSVATSRAPSPATAAPLPTAVATSTPGCTRSVAACAAGTTRQEAATTAAATCCSWVVLCCWAWHCTTRTRTGRVAAEDVNGCTRALPLFARACMVTLLMGWWVGACQTQQPQQAVGIAIRDVIERVAMLCAFLPS